MLTGWALHVPTAIHQSDTLWDEPIKSFFFSQKYLQDILWPYMATQLQKNGTMWAHPSEPNSALLPVHHTIALMTTRPERVDCGWQSRRNIVDVYCAQCHSFVVWPKSTPPVCCAPASPRRCLCTRTRIFRAEMCLSNRSIHWWHQCCNESCWPGIQSRRWVNHCRIDIYGKTITVGPLCP